MCAWRNRFCGDGVQGIRSTSSDFHTSSCVLLCTDAEALKAADVSIDTQARPDGTGSTGPSGGAAGAAKDVHDYGRPKQLSSGAAAAEVQELLGACWASCGGAAGTPGAGHRHQAPGTRHQACSCLS